MKTCKAHCQQKCWFSTAESEVLLLVLSPQRLQLILLSHWG